VRISQQTIDKEVPAVCGENRARGALSTKRVDNKSSKGGRYG